MWFQMVKLTSKLTSASSIVEPCSGLTVCTTCAMKACHVMFLNFAAYDHGASLHRCSAYAAATKNIHVGLVSM